MLSLEVLMFYLWCSFIDYTPHNFTPHFMLRYVENNGPVNLYSIQSLSH